MTDISRLDPAPAGFGKCAECDYRETGSASICYACAATTLDPMPASRCRVCDQSVTAGAECRNWWCRRPDSEREFMGVRAIAMRTKQLERAIGLYKDRGKQGWANVFARVLVGWLDQAETTWRQWDIITPSPTYVGAGARRSWDHIGLIIDKAHTEAAGRWPFDIGPRRVIAKTAETDSLRTMKMWDRRNYCASTLRPLLSVPDSALVAGKNVLVFDDVFTEGSTLQEVARALKAAGAANVAEVVLARQPWT